ncbi:hypothetical protein KEM55_006064, partial [Ascosphaera atra]
DMEAVHLRQGVVDAMRIAEAGNLLIQKNKLDNSLIANEPERAAAVVGIVLNIIHLVSAVFSPYLPATAKSIVEQLNVEPAKIPTLEEIKDGWKPTCIKPGHKIGKAKYLFSMIDPKKADEWREHYGGSQEERQKKADEAAKIAAKKAANKAKKLERKNKKQTGKPEEGKPTQEGSGDQGKDNAGEVDKITEGVKDTKISS